MLEIHKKARSSSITSYHNFLLTYDPNKKILYAFFEGQEDESFYINPIYENKPDSYKVWTCWSGNKDTLYEIYKKINWQNYPKNRILFFADKDLSDIIEINYPEEENIFVTEWYSVENYVVTEYMFERVIKELFHINDNETIDKLNKIYKENINIFYKQMRPVMAWIICCKRENIRLQLCNIDLKKILLFNKDYKLLRAQLKQKCRLLHLEEICSVSRLNNLRKKLKKTLCELKGYGSPKRYLRGKYELWFFITFVNCVYENIVDISEDIKKKPKVHISLGYPNAMEILGPRIESIPQLDKFLKSNMLKIA